ncbi:DUF1471 family periplasmic protein McbA [Shimwellia blattae]|uniref:Putative secreted protein n=1 Tax=Shimwellia blattae (strain ATCC 29907 / DSM 4481 / JCM 1650 / NBRC 105725 / CDC 9005-74) TaxID=630626 RepID=I2BAY2_SHIBC|nr:DUF1471 family periplasmic protein McbA [Shimwellia blattae]AFJ47686.1 putative secreted protein [Shimwellia blattae DSM 4481 = NBRC 105725]GAB79734.1 McbA protein [Shimwellia blattae DSM 4481 = NBRC 105725]VDY65186.1 Multiple stress resistance protein BhsA precursor [Shimwellia blattae]VEC23836.1 Multiple stress resistance protein BhsA precursor [Shimwellia blattae]
MKKLLLVVTAALLVSAAHGSFAAQTLTQEQLGQLHKAGTVSASGASNLDDLQAQLAEKARQEGAKGYVITSAGGENKMFGTANIYK